MTESAALADTAVALDNSPELAMPALHRAVIGPMGEDYYLPIFSRFEAAGEATLSWNWSACLFSVNWILFRGLWGVALVFVAVMLGLLLLLVGLDQLVFDWPPEVLYGLIATGLSLGLLVSGAWGNALFFNHSRKAMMAAIEANPSLELACAQLRQQASSRGRLMRILLANLLVLAAGALAYTLLLPGAGLSFDSAAPEKAAEVAAETPSETAAEPAAPASQAASALVELASVALDPESSETDATAADGIMAAASDTAAAEPTAAISSAAAASAPTSAPAPAPAPASASPSALVPASTPVSIPAPTPAPALAQGPISASTSKPERESRASAAEPIASAAPQATAASVISNAKPTAQAEPEKSAKSTETAIPAKVAATKGFFVNAGLFAQPDNARNTLAKLTAAGLPAFSQELQTPQGPRIRVRVGPFAKRAQAEAAIKKIQALKLDAALAKP